MSKRVATTATNAFGFADLPEDAQLAIFEAVSTRRERARLCLALPRIGLVALRLFKTYRDDPLLSVAFALEEVRGVVEIIDERLLRKYALREDATREGCEWLRSVASELGWDLYIRTYDDGMWYLLQGTSPGAVLRGVGQGGILHFYAGEFRNRLVKTKNAKGHVCHYQGAQTREYLTRIEFANGGCVKHYKGARGLERKVRTEFRNGSAKQYEGERSQECLRRFTYSNGKAIHYAGPRNEECFTHIEFPNGLVKYYEGSKGEERLVRHVYANGSVTHYTGHKKQEKMSRIELPNGVVRHYLWGEGSEIPEGESFYKTVFPTGQVDYYTGKAGVWRLLRAELPNADVAHYEGPRGEERLYCIDFANGSTTVYTGPKGEERPVTSTMEGTGVTCNRVAMSF